jgi:glucose-1-phosphate thymidylyltransferase long form
VTGVPLKGVILAAGEGVRLLPLTANRPKPMVPIAGKPLLEYNLDQLAAAGVRHVLVLISPQGDAIRRHFGHSHRGVDLEYAVQDEPLGTGHALRILAKGVGGEAFFCIFGDNITTWPVSRLAPVHREMGAAATLALFHAKDPRRHGVVEMDGRRIRSIVERPEHPPSDLASAGMFIFEPVIFQVLSEIQPTLRGELELPDAIQRLIVRDLTVAYKVLDEWRLNVNTPADVLEANHHMLDHLGETDRAPGIEPPVIAAGRPTIWPGAHLGPHVSCGEGCVMEPDATVSESILLDNVTVGARAVVQRSILGESVHVMPDARVVDQVVADRAVCR